MRHDGRLTKYEVTICNTQDWTDEAEEAVKAVIFDRRKEKKLLAALVEAAAALLPAGAGLLVEATIADDSCLDLQDTYLASQPAHGPCPLKLLPRLDVAVAAD